MSPVTRTMAAGLAAIALLIAGALMDGPTELQAAQDVAEAVDELQYQAVVDEGGKAFCAQFYRVPHFRPDGDLICRESAPVLAQGVE